MFVVRILHTNLYTEVQASNIRSIFLCSELYFWTQHVRGAAYKFLFAIYILNSTYVCAENNSKARTASVSITYLKAVAPFHVTSLFIFSITCTLVLLLRLANRCEYRASKVGLSSGAVEYYSPVKSNNPNIAYKFTISYQMKLPKGRKIIILGR